MEAEEEEPQKQVEGVWLIARKWLLSGHGVMLLQLRSLSGVLPPRILRRCPA